MDVDIGLAAPSVVVQKLFPLPLWLAAILNFGSLIVDQRRTTSSSVLNVKSMSGVVENLAAAFEIASQSSTIQALFPVPVWWPPSWIRSQKRQETSTLSYSCRSWSKMWGRYLDLCTYVAARMPKHPELDSWGTELGFFRNSHGLQNYSKQTGTEGVQICLKYQALTRCSRAKV